MSEEDVTKLINDNKLMIFSKDYCPFCHQVKDLFKNNGVEEFGIVEMDKVDNGASLHNALKAYCNQRTVPVVYIEGVKIGGCDDTKAAAANGKLKEALDKAGIANSF